MGWIQAKLLPWLKQGMVVIMECAACPLYNAPWHTQAHTTQQTTAQKQCLTGDVLIAVNAKVVALGKREAQMKEKESAFSAIQTRMDAQLSTLEAAKASLDASVNKRTKQAQDDIVHLTLMYQTMKPKDAAKIFDEMDVNFAAGFLREMKGPQSGLILSNMNAKTAYKISLIMSSRGAKYR